MDLVSPESDSSDCLSMNQLVTELAKNRVTLLEDISTLIQDSVRPIQAAVDALRDTVSSFQERLVSAEALAR